MVRFPVALLHMRTLFLILGGLFVALIAYWGIRFYLTVQVSKKLIEAAVLYEKASEDNSITMLVLGDSTSVGVGADTSLDTVAGQAATHINATSVENYAKSGAVTKDLSGQIANATEDRYGLILIQIGGNDIIRFKNARETAEELRAAIKALPLADTVVIISAGDVGGATLFPFFVRPFHTRLNNEYHEAFAKVAEEEGVTYVNFGNAPATKTISARPDIYLSADGLHPSTAGYTLWFETIKPSL